MDECSVGRIKVPEQTPALLGSTTMAASLMDVENSFGQTSHLVNRLRNISEEEDDDVVFIESVQPPLVSAPAVVNQRNISSKRDTLQGPSCIIFPPSKELTSQNLNISETIVIDDEEDIETDHGQKKNSFGFIEWGLPGIKNTKDLDFSASSLSRSKSKIGVGPFNPGRMNVAGDMFENGESAPHHSPDSWISQSASFPRNQKQPEVESLSPVALLPKIFQPSLEQQVTKSAKITCANCKRPLQKGQTAYQRKGSAHLFCSTTCLSSFPHKRAPKKRSAMCKKNAPAEKAAAIAQVDSSKSSQEFYNTSSLSPYEDKQNLGKRVLNKSRCTICNKITEIRHEVGINNVTHKLCSNQCFNKYRLANGLTMNCCEQCGEYMASKSAGNDVLMIEGQQKRFCCQSCVSEYKQMIETKSNRLSSPENRKRNDIDRETDGRILYGLLDTPLEKRDGIPEKKEKTSELQFSVECNMSTSMRKDEVNLPSSISATDGTTVLEHLEEENSTVPVLLSADPGTWPRILSIKQWDCLVENDPPQVRNFNFPKDSTGRKFSETYYTRILPNGEKTTRSWLLYSTSKDSVFCLYCRLFGEGKNQLKNEHGCKDWQHLSHILSKHEESEMHLNNSAKYSKFKSDLKKNKTLEAAEQRLCKDEKNDDVLLLYT
ncbi:PREDICTED: zinc finger MYM-type protein 5 [Elephantulus edwardii]|uniref:zinc finger MYM-type protein 5 n=1 Tax=Elephantulus edwardii TaxID=28737 RepID=UPI0003F0C5A3|nr:PREDICTED: zinc finger MYM-type protein 5 [Elephantulus edwardii]